MKAAATALLILASCAHPCMHLRLVCSDTLVIDADVHPGVTSLSASTWQQRAGETVTCKANLYEAKDRK